MPHDRSQDARVCARWHGAVVRCLTCVRVVVHILAADPCLRHRHTRAYCCVRPTTGEGRATRPARVPATASRTRPASIPSEHVRRFNAGFSCKRSVVATVDERRITPRKRHATRPISFGPALSHTLMKAATDRSAQLNLPACFEALYHTKTCFTETEFRRHMRGHVDSTPLETSH